MSDSSFAEGWAPYFEELDDGAPSQALLEQLEECEEDIFDESSSSFTISDVVDG